MSRKASAWLRQVPAPIKARALVHRLPADVDWPEPSASPSSAGRSVSHDASAR
ncbi:hypothetical protein [Comamonas serinivorans]|uniref:hypothetical protein n=1 Tax=Comamonas serinivorans TaxID=1082851 RepID=UPI0012FBD498|nr:hypothetical protein [Comamonas serinivorans]